MNKYALLLQLQFVPPNESFYFVFFIFVNALRGPCFQKFYQLSSCFEIDMSDENVVHIAVPQNALKEICTSH